MREAQFRRKINVQLVSQSVKFLIPVGENQRKEENWA